uniref:CCHC-type domain-containing protein n=1 Tax=Lactuca sativa TaxID=4236 RepID=A0A9R1VNZ5_LACSA|nr:hypothetical protein LSAT_V11C400171450 [Lactuca sativa]
MEKIKYVDSQAYDYLIDKDPTTWSKAFFKEGRDCDAVENRLSESFNSAIRHARRKSIITMLEEISIFVRERTYIKAYLKCYNYNINSLNGSDMWPEVPYQNPLPPKIRRLPGRPSVKRKRDAVERELSGPVRHSVIRKGALIRCSMCKEPGHNKKKCPSKQETNTSGKCPNHLYIIHQFDNSCKVCPKKGPIGRSGQRQYSERIVKMAFRRNIPRVGSSAEIPAVLD